MQILDRLYRKAYRLIREHASVLRKFDELASEIWSAKILHEEYVDDRGLSDVVLYGGTPLEFDEFCKRMDKAKKHNLEQTEMR